VAAGCSAAASSPSVSGAAEVEPFVFRGRLGAPAVYLDLYLIKDSNPLQWRIDELRRILNARLIDHAGPVVVEGIMVLDALGAIGRKPNFLIDLDGEGGRLFSSRLAAYRARHHPEQRADFRLQGFAE
jgi:hypothetical protein